MIRLSLFLVALAAWAAPAAAQDAYGCPYNARMALERRPSPLDSVVFRIGDAEVKVCYGRPSARGRTMIGGEHVPFGQVWRTGANETTKIHSPVPLSIAGVEVAAGTYALYTVLGAAEWQIIVNRAWEQWGHERNYTAEVEAQEVGRGTVPVERTGEHVEAFSIRAEPHGEHGVQLVLEWERTRVRVPIMSAGGHGR